MTRYEAGRFWRGAARLVPRQRVDQAFEALVTKQQPYVESARSIGTADRAILFRYIFPNGLLPLIVQCTVVVTFTIISEGTLSLLGAGVDSETPT